ncbi:hypothetical protein COLO4_03916 [Corchorus olitorius]|uniref:Uncharacterized protein n=1 Tax=Corchorus olitorius TaxID=93759 RepID=A0A1R3KW47_9ROSI|nr:hypothetical protein COLO4_03916 [Corchorus olitorius]
MYLTKKPTKKIRQKHRNLQKLSLIWLDTPNPCETRCLLRLETSQEIRSIGLFWKSLLNGRAAIRDVNVIPYSKVLEKATTGQLEKGSGSFPSPANDAGIFRWHPNYSI